MSGSNLDFALAIHRALNSALNRGPSFIDLQRITESTLWFRILPVSCVTIYQFFFNILPILDPTFHWFLVQHFASPRFNTSPVSCSTFYQFLFYILPFRGQTFCQFSVQYFTSFLFNILPVVGPLFYQFMVQYFYSS